MESQPLITEKRREERAAGPAGVEFDGLRLPVGGQVSLASLER